MHLNWNRALVLIIALLPLCMGQAAVLSHGLYEDFRFPLTSTNGAVRQLITQRTNFPALNATNAFAHILARELTEPLLSDAVSNGHCYVAYDDLRAPAGFLFGAINNLGVFTMGDTAPMLGKTRVVALTPAPATLRLFLKDTMVSETNGTNLTFAAEDSGTYRVEASLNVDGKSHAWIFSMPVQLRAPGVADFQLPSMDISPGVELHRDIPYCEGPAADADKHKLDVYTPINKPRAPVFFFIHGGAWKSGDRSYYPPLGNRYAQEGLVTVIPSYRLAPKHKYPAQIEDVAAAFAWTVRHIADYGGDTNRIYVGGHSAGGHLAALLGLDETALAAHKLSPKLIRGILALSGVYDLTVGDFQNSVFGKDPQIRHDASPLFHIKAGAPPFLITYCQWDYFSLPAQAREFHHALQAAGDSAELVYVPGQNHLSEMINVTSPTDPLVSAALKFMR